jgi:tetratricopeptide (TPR) repeat protein
VIRCRQWIRFGFAGTALLAFGLIAGSALAGLPRGAPDSNPIIDQGRHQFDIGNYQGAVGTFKNAVAQNSNNAQAYYWLGRAYFELHDLQNSITQLEKATQLDAKNSDYHYWLARAYGDEADRERSFFLARKVKKEFEAAVQLDGSNIKARRDLEEFNIQAPWVVGGSKDAAREQMEAIVAIDPVQGHLARATYDLEVQKKPDLALNEYKMLLTEHPTKLEPYLELCDAYRQLNRPEDMGPALDAADKVKSGDPRTAYYRAVQHILSNSQIQAAEPLLKAYLANTPDRTDWPSHASARVYLGRLYEQEGKRQDAAEQYREALQLQPGNKEAKEKLQKLEKGG